MFEKKFYCNYNEAMCEFAIAVANGDVSFTSANYPSSAIIEYARFIEGASKFKAQLDQLVKLYYAHATDEGRTAYAEVIKKSRHYFKNLLKVFGSRQPTKEGGPSRPLFNLDEAGFYCLGLEMAGIADKDVARHITIMIGNVLQGRPAMEKTAMETKKDSDQKQAKKARETAKSRKKVLAEKDECITRLEAENTALKAVQVDRKKLATLINKSHASDKEKAEMLALLGIKPSKKA
jgi:hypothetical protein